MSYFCNVKGFNFQRNPLEKRDIFNMYDYNGMFVVVDLCLGEGVNCWPMCVWGRGGGHVLAQFWGWMNVVDKWRGNNVDI